MTIGNELDQAFYNIVQRVTKLENNSTHDADGFDPDDLRCDLMSEVEEVRDYVSSECEELRDCISYESDRIDDIEAYKCDEDEVRDIAIDVCREEISESFVNYDEFYSLQKRVLELEDRLNKPSLGARVLRWLREGPSIKEVATNWYAGIRRGR